MASDRGVREKLAIASAETYKMLRTDMSEIIKTSDWKRARGVGFTEVQAAVVQQSKGNDKSFFGRPFVASIDLGTPFVLCNTCGASLQAYEAVDFTKG